MSERKVLNKYYPPDFDPTKIPRLPKNRDQRFSIRIMAPFNMRCNTCGEYIYKGKKFNSRKETVENENYLGLHIFRFYIKCPRCVAEIAFKTDPENTDYSLEAGATRNFEAAKTAEILAKKEIKEKEDEELNNPMKVLENRTKASQREIEMLETLEELRTLNSRHATVDHENMINVYRIYEQNLKELQENEDEDFIKSMFKNDTIKRIAEVEDKEENKISKVRKSEKPTDVFSDKSNDQNKKLTSWAKSVGSLGSNQKLPLVIKKKSTVNPSSSSLNVSTSTKESTFNTDSSSLHDSSKHSDTVSAKSNSSVSSQPNNALKLLARYSDTDSSDDNT